MFLPQFSRKSDGRIKNSICFNFDARQVLFMVSQLSVEDDDVDLNNFDESCEFEVKLNWKSV